MTRTAESKQVSPLIPGGPPKFDVKFRAHAVKRGEKARLQCTAMGDLPIAMTWSKNNDRVPEKSKYKVSTVANQSLSSVSSTLVVSTETVEDSGIYSCFAKNHYGSDETSMRLLVQEVPGPPVNVTVANATGNSLFLTWGEPFRGNSAITRYLVQFREAGSALVAVRSTSLFMDGCREGGVWGGNNSGGRVSPRRQADQKRAC
ncbi:hypothetical protein HPB49_004343 [Dermacentor silvarum]|uniref:Uncharacterized protein n=1 Tax=Dermacentor silvarum TaxID=543639 RepID=A0ACB8DUH9_DERSI|nr:hypothetical protein HPB49_004343 [Dermacentor silvarum]